MKNKFVTRVLSLVLVAALMCSFSIAASAATGTEYWTGNDGTSYVASVTNNQTKTTDLIAILDSTVHLAKNGRYDFGGCTYLVSFSNTLWTRNVERLDAAGAKVQVRSSYSINKTFVDTYSFRATSYAGSYCATTDGYGYVGSFYVQKLTQTPVTTYHGDFTFAPCGCANVITSVIDVNFA